MIRRLLAGASLAAVAGLALSPLVLVPPVAADVSGPTVSVTPTDNLTDGAPVTVTIHTTSDAPVAKAEAILCRAGVTYTGSTTRFPSPDSTDGGPNCPPDTQRLSSSGDGVIFDTTTGAASTPDGESFLYRIGSGTATWTDVTDHTTSRTLTCDDKNPCALVVNVSYTPPGGPSQWKPFVSTITFGVSDPIAGCGGAADDALQTSGSDRIQNAWVAWTLGTCAEHPDVHAPSRATFVGEDAAMTQFSNGALDLAYTAGGYDADMAKGSTPDSGLTRSDVPRRPAVAVPIALNAAVLGVGNGWKGVNGDGQHKVPYKTVQLTAPEVATLISGGKQGMALTFPGSSPPERWDQEIYSHNPELAGSAMFVSCSGGCFSEGVGILAPGDASSWYASRWLKGAAPDAWTVPPQFPKYGGQARQVDASFGRAIPDFQGAAATESGRPSMIKALIGPGTVDVGGEWMLADLETIKALNITPVQIPDSAGKFVAPTADTMTAAVSSMKPDDQGILISDPKATPAGAYPLTFVEYALVPTAPLVNDDCTLRTGAEKLLTNWLSYITTDGQAKLPSGMVPLPDSLKSQAADAIAKVGTAPVTGKCASLVQPPTIAPPSAAPAAAPPAASVGAPVGAPAASGGSPLSDVGSPLAADYSQPPAIATGTPASAASDAQSGAAAALPPGLPAFAGRRSPGWGGPVLALLGIIALSSLALLATTRRPAQ